MSPPRKHPEADPLQVAPCPFCAGETPQVMSTEDRLATRVRTVRWIFCSKCHASGPVEETLIAAVEKWNARAMVRR